VLPVTLFETPEMFYVGDKVGTFGEGRVGAVFQQRGDLDGKGSRPLPDTCGDDGAETGMEGITGDLTSETGGTAL
jgi:hypothetical protein